MICDKWKFAIGFPEKRKKDLAGIGHFLDVVALVHNSMHAIHVRPKHGRDGGLKQATQAIFTFSVSREAFDAFFNSAAGYRAQYLVNPLVGLAMNLYLLKRIEQPLIEAAFHSGEPELSDAKRSLRAVSSKIWIDEDFYVFNPPSRDLAIETWEKEANAGSDKAKWGLSAPEGTRLQVKGALLDRWGNELVPQKKVLRHEEIHRYGYS
ncbi:MAG: hypothetical protein P8X48_10235 [Acidiferrobacteraceae bacterium]|jgi:hypothetical protein